MARKSAGLLFDKIGYWSELKLEIISKYATAYSKILNNQPDYIHHAYVDGFSGPGMCVSRTSGELVAGSPLNALDVRPRFERFFFIDLDGNRMDYLKTLAADERAAVPSLDVRLFQGDCNRILLEEVLPLLQWKDYWRALCVLDPYGLHLDWQVIERAGQLGTIDLFLNFPTMAMNREALWIDTGAVDGASLARMTAFWGDDSWRTAAYTVQPDLFGEEHLHKKGNRDVVAAFRKRLKDVAGFKIVPDPLPMKNSAGSTVYYLFFASAKEVASTIVTDIFDKYRLRAG